MKIKIKLSEVPGFTPVVGSRCFTCPDPAAALHDFLGTRSFTLLGDNVNIYSEKSSGELGISQEEAQDTVDKGTMPYTHAELVLDDPAFG